MRNVRIRKPGKLRLDMALIVMSVFAIYGGVVIFRSFAQTPVDATQLGTINLQGANASETQSANSREITYHLKTTAGLQYCFWGTYATSAGIELRATGGKTSRQERQEFRDSTNIPAEVVCFTTSDDGDTKVTLTIHGDITLRFLKISLE